MEKYFHLIHQNDLFEGTSRNDFETMISCLGPIYKKYTKSEFILHSGDRIDFIGIVITGVIKVIKIDEEGNESILNKLTSLEMFGEVFACANVLQSPVSIIAESDCNILFLNYKKVITVCNASCEFHQTLISNMLKIIAKKSLFLNQKIDIISKKTLRSKLLAFFDYARNGQTKFVIRLNREELANFLCADRSAISSELSKMQKENLIKYHKNEFELLP